MKTTDEWVAVPAWWFVEAVSKEAAALNLTHWSAGQKGVRVVTNEEWERRVCFDFQRNVEKKRMEWSTAIGGRAAGTFLSDAHLEALTKEEVIQTLLKSFQTHLSLLQTEQ